MKRFFISVMALAMTLIAFAQTNLFDASQASIKETFIAPNWNVDAASNATYDSSTGVVKVHIANQCYAQWQAQVKINHNITFDPAKRYKLSCTLNATIDVNGVTIKMDDDAIVVMENVDGLKANQDYLFSAEGDGVAQTNKILVFDFGWAGACDITISNISVIEVGSSTPTVHPEAAPIPTEEAVNVFSIYSDAYTSTVVRNTGGWGQTTIEAEVALAENDKAFYYTKANYLGWELNGNTSIGDLTAYPTIHMDIYVAEDATIQFTPIWTGIAENMKTYSLKAGWNALDIDLATDFPAIKWAEIIQLKWAEMPQTCYIDNVYFVKSSTTGLEAVEETQTITRKVIQNGQVYILRDGVRYTILGTQVQE